MKTALILSSNVAASQVGATASAFCLRRMGINTIVLPTTVLGRHPGWGDPGGKAVPATQLRDMWRAIIHSGKPCFGYKNEISTPRRHHNPELLGVFFPDRSKYFELRRRPQNRQSFAY